MDISVGDFCVRHMEDVAARGNLRARLLRICEAGCRNHASWGRCYMAVTETGHLASREVDELYRRHGGEVYRYAYAVLGNHADAEDVTQTTFLNAYRSLEQGVRPRKPSNWLLTIASNAIKQRFRHEQARPHQVELDDRIAGSEVEDDGRRRRASDGTGEDPPAAAAGHRSS